MTPSYAIHQVNGEAHVASLSFLQGACFPDDTLLPTDDGSWWWETTFAGEPVAFAAMSLIYDAEGTHAYLSRAGVVEAHRGHGLQRRLIDARERLARKLGCRSLVTTTFCNPPSGNNLIKAGFALYDPEEPWGATGTNYWRKDLMTCFH